MHIQHTRTHIPIYYFVEEEESSQNDGRDERRKKETLYINCLESHMEKLLC